MIWLNDQRQKIEGSRKGRIKKQQPKVSQELKRLIDWKMERANKNILEKEGHLLGQQEDHSPKSRRLYEKLQAGLNEKCQSSKRRPEL